MENRKPRFAIMGEFSSGKSTLCNLLMGARPLLEKVTATQLPPVWASYGNEPAYREDLDGERFEIDLGDLASVDLEDTRLVRIFMESDLLQMCDLIDMPGISDPNMSSDVWERVIHLADGVLWCTHATQAWRQSEVGTWTGLPESLRENSMLLVTRIDKILNENDRTRVLKRVTAETRGLFSGIYPISLTQAMAAGDDIDLWTSSGAHDFAEAFLAIVSRLSESDLPEVDTVTLPAVPAKAKPPTELEPEPEAELSLPAHLSKGSEHPQSDTETNPSDDSEGVVAIVPRRVTAEGNRHDRPRRTDNVVYMSTQPDGAPSPKVPDDRLRSVFR